MVDPLDIKAVADAMHQVLRQKGFDSFVPDGEVQSMAEYMVKSLDYARAHRKPAAPKPPTLEPAPIK